MSGKIPSLTPPTGGHPALVQSYLKFKFTWSHTAPTADTIPTFHPRGQCHTVLPMSALPFCRLLTCPPVDSLWLLCIWCSGPLFCLWTFSFLLEHCSDSPLTTLFSCPRQQASRFLVVTRTPPGGPDTISPASGPQMEPECVSFYVSEMGAQCIKRHPVFQPTVWRTIAYWTTCLCGTWIYGLLTLSERDLVLLISVCRGSGKKADTL